MLNDKYLCLKSYSFALEIINDAQDYAGHCSRSEIKPSDLHLAVEFRDEGLDESYSRCSWAKHAPDEGPAAGRRIQRQRARCSSPSFYLPVAPSEVALPSS